MKEKTIHELYIDRNRLLATKQVTNNLLVILAVNEKLGEIESDIALHEAEEAILFLTTSKGR